MADLQVYGTQEEVAALAKMWTRAGVWVDPDLPLEKGTNPTLTQVEEWLENVSAQMNLALQSRNFIIPFDVNTSPNAYNAISQYVVSLVADLCHYVNSSGRFYTEKLVERGITPMAAILKDMLGWTDINELGLIGDGLEQNEIQLPRNQLQIRVIGQFPRYGYRGRRLP